MKNHGYILSSILMHEGDEPSSGHYYSYIFNHSNKKWFKFSDIHVNEEKDEELIFKEAYGFLYLITYFDYII